MTQKYEPMSEAELALDEQQARQLMAHDETGDFAHLSVIMLRYIATIRALQEEIKGLRQKLEQQDGAG